MVRALSASGNGGVQQTCQKSAPAGDATVLDVKNVARCADLSERRGVRAGQPDLRAERCELAEQRGAPGGIEMGDDLVEQQKRGDPGRLRNEGGMGEHQ